MSIITDFLKSMTEGEINDKFWSLSDNVTQVMIILFIIFMIGTGWHKGFVKKAVALGSIVLTVILESRLFPYVAAYIDRNEALHQFFMSYANALMQSAGVTDAGAAGAAVYNFLGMDSLAKTATGLMENVAAKLICFILIFILVRVLLMVVTKIFGNFKNIHLVDKVDRFLGAVLGLVESVIIVWIFMLIAFALPGIPIFRAIIEDIVSSPFLSFLASQNIILRMFASMFT